MYNVTMAMLIPMEKDITYVKLLCLKQTKNSKYKVLLDLLDC